MEGQKKEEITNQGSDLARISRNSIERNRRIHIKSLFSELFSLVPTSQNSKLSVPELVDKAIIYTKQLLEEIEEMKERKKLLMNGDQYFEPVLDIGHSSEHSTVKVTIISGLEKNFLLHQVIRVLEEEGAEVVSTTYHTAGDMVFYTIYSQAFNSRIGIETSRVDERLKKLIS